MGTRPEVGTKGRRRRRRRRRGVNCFSHAEVGYSNPELE
jgi:hypothetical protein